MKKTGVLWVVQVLLAAVFLFAGVVKLMMPAAVLQKQASISGDFLHFIAAAEVLGALGLVLPGLLRMARWLTPLAAVGLMTIMIGATVMTLATPQPALAVVPFLAGLLAAFVGYNRQKEVAQ